MAPGEKSQWQSRAEDLFSANAEVSLEILKCRFLLEVKAELIPRMTMLAG